jgi:hypothetical protein
MFSPLRVSSNNKESVNIGDHSYDHRQQLILCKVRTNLHPVLSHLTNPRDIKHAIVGMLIFKPTLDDSYDSFCSLASSNVLHLLICLTNHANNQ